MVIGKGWYFRFDDDNKMKYIYIFSFIKTTVGQLQNTQPHIMQLSKISHTEQKLLHINDCEWNRRFKHVHFKGSHLEPVKMTEGKKNATSEGRTADHIT